jgi:serine/threonine protein kinase
VFQDQSHLYLVMERVQGLELYNHIIEITRMTEKQAAYIIKQLLNAINHLNSLHIVHRDLKLENIIINPKTNQI